MKKIYSTILGILVLFTQIGYSQCNVGNESPLFTGVTSFTVGYILGTKYTVTSGGTLTDLSTNGTGAGAQVKMALYADNAGVPGALLRTSSVGTMINGTVTMPVTSMAISPGNYWVMAIYSTSYGGGRQGGATTQIFYQSATFGAALPSSGAGFSNYQGSSFNYWMNITCSVAVPAITSFTPSSSCGGSTSVVITGTNFTGATAVTFGGTNAQSFVVNSATQITAVAGTGNTGTVGVVTAGGTATSTSVFRVNAAPALSSSSSPSGAVCNGTGVTLSAATTNNLVAYYQFEEGAGTTTTDISGNNLTATFQSTALWTGSSAPVSGTSNAVYVNNGYLSVPDNAAFNSMQNNLTIEAYIYQFDNGNNTIVDRANYNFLFEACPNGQTGLGFYNNNGGWTYSAGTIPVNQWTHVAVTWNGTTGVLTFYMNGNVLSTHSRPTPLSFNAGPMNIGRQEPNSCQCNTMTGIIDELRLWNTVRTQAQITTNLGAEMAPPAVTFTWAPSSGLNTVSGASVIATPSSTTTYTVTGTSASGCTTTSSQTVTILANYNIIASAGANGSISPNGTSAVCSGANQSYTITPNGGFHILDVLVDGISNSGAIASGTFTFAGVTAAHTISVTFAPNCTAPTFTICPGNQAANVATGVCSNTVTYATATSGTTPTITYSFSGATAGSGSGDGSGSTFNKGTTTVALTATNGCGTATCSFNVVVTDNQNPTIVAPASVSGITNTGCTATGVSLGTTTTADNCSVASVTNDAPSSFPVGNTTVTWTVTDGSGNTATASQIVTVTDNVNPTITAPSDVTVCSGAAISLGTPLTSDNCTAASTTNNAPGSYSLGTTVITWTVTDGSGNTATATQNVIVNPLPIGSASDIVICNGDPSNLPLSSDLANTTFTWSSAVTVGGVVGNGSCPSGCGTTIADVLTNTGFVHGVVEYTITPTSADGCVGSDFTATVTVGAAPAQPVISGPSVVCNMNTATYSVAAVPEATLYTWTVPTGVTGMTILSGQGTNSITVSISAGTVTGNVTCTASNNCGSSTTASMAVTKKPAVPGAISGPTSTCGQTTATYSIAAVFGATSYAWTVPANMTITSGQGTTSINVSMTSAFVYGQVKVSAVNNCGNIPGTGIIVTGNVAPAPVAISGPSNVCGLTTATYSIPSVTGATGYNWTIAGAGTIIGSNTGTSVTVALNGTTGGSISCASTNVCGNGTARTLNLVVTATQPGLISGPTTICGVNTATYTVASVGAGYTYNWSLTLGSGWSITSGQGTNSITISGTSVSTNPLSGLVKVTSTNTCGMTSAFRTMAVTYCHDGIAMNNANESKTTTFSNIYPNPTSSEFTIDVISTSSTTENQEVTVEVYDVLGNLVIHAKHQLVSGTNTMKTNIEDFKNAMYFVRLLDVDSNVIHTQTVIKQ